MRKMSPRNLAILVHDDVEVLDFCGPFEAFGVTGQAVITRLFGLQEADDVATYMMYRWAEEDRARAAALAAAPV